MAIVIAFYVIPMWVFWVIGNRSLSDVGDILSDGRVARLLLGLALGTGLAFVLAKSETPPIRFVFSVGIGILFVALAAPHIDGWLRRVTGLKSPLIELQLAGSSTHRVAVVESAAILFNEQSLKYLTNYDQMIGADIEYFQHFGIEGSSGPTDQKTITIIERSQALQRTFHDVVRPVAKCVQTAIDKNLLSMEASRRLMASSVERLEQIIFAEETFPSDEKPDNDMDREFWGAVTQLPQDIMNKMPVSLASKIKQCSAYVPPTNLDKLAHYREYKDLPYLHAAAALLVSFMGDTDKALEVLQRAAADKQGDKQVLAFKDYRFLFVMSKLAFVQGNPSDVNLYYDPLYEMWKLARDRKVNLQSINAQCGADKHKISAFCYAQIYQIAAANLAAYYLAEDLARGNRRAAGYKSRIKEFAASLDAAVKDLDSRGSNDQYYSYLRGARYDLLDTYAYATLVLEATKHSPDYDLIRREALDVLESVAEHREQHTTSAHPTETERKVLISELRITQAHLESAQEQMGQ